MEAGLKALERVRNATGLPILTDVHDAGQVSGAAQVADVLQIPAFLCRQTDLLVAAGKAGKPVNVKKGQWMSAEGMAGAIDKVRAGGAPEVAVTERGTFFGYGDLVVDMRNFTRLRAACRAPVIFDATHAVQQPGAGADGASGGLREFIPPLLYAAAAAGADAFFLETHPDPDHAPSDGPNMLPLNQLEEILKRALGVWHSARAEGAAAARSQGSGGGESRTERRPRPRVEGDVVDPTLARRLKLVDSTSTASSPTAASTSAAPATTRWSSSASTSRTDWESNCCVMPGSSWPW